MNIDFDNLEPELKPQDDPDNRRYVNDRDGILMYSIAVSLKKIRENTDFIKDAVNDGRFTQEATFNAMMNR